MHDDPDDYVLLDAGDDERLEQFGPYIVARPAPGAIGPRRHPEVWATPDLRFSRDGGWVGPALATLPGAIRPTDDPVVSDNGRPSVQPWTTRLGGISMLLRPTSAGQVGCFPEHAATLPWVRDAVRRRSTHDHRPTALHLFGATGLTTLVLAASGASVVHVDAARTMVGWARENARHNALADAPIRWIVNDAGVFVAREARRGHRYDVIVLDPPSYGHGDGRTWRLERDLHPLLASLRTILADDGSVLLTTHTTGLDEFDLAAMLAAAGIPGTATTGELTIRAQSGVDLRLGAVAHTGDTP